jgi:hypothetical protein
MTIKHYVLGIALGPLAVLTLVAEEAPLTEVERMRAASLAPFPREAPAAVTNNTTTPWQQPAPKSLRKSSRPPLVAEYKFAPHVSATETGTKQRFAAATETLALGLTGDPPRPAYPQLEAGPRSFAPSFTAQEHLLIPPLSRTSEAKVTLASDAATITLKPFTSAVVNASRPPAPARTESIPDPFVAREEVRLRAVPPDNDPPPLRFDLPDCPLLPVSSLQKPVSSLQK